MPNLAGFLQNLRGLAAIIYVLLLSRKSASSLVISSNSQGAMSSSFMRVAADSDFLNNQGTLANFTYNQVPSQFKGIETYYDIRGNFKNGWHFSQGRIDGLVKKSRGVVAGSRCQSWRVCEEVGRTYGLGTPGSGVGGWVNIRTECTLYTVGFCNGWNDYEWTTGTLGLGNNWGGPIDTEWGNCDETCQEYAMLEQITNNLTHPCLQNVLDDLKSRGIASTLNAFNNRNPNISLNFVEGTLPTGICGKTTGRGRSQTIILDYNQLSHATDLFIALTIIHETVHAFFVMDLTVNHPDWLTQTTLQNNVPFEQFQYYDFMKCHIDGHGGNEAQHLQMIATYRSYIRDALVNYFGSVDIDMTDICSDLAWAGLVQHSTTLSTSEKTRINNRIKAELKRETVEGQVPKGRRQCD